MSFAEQTLKLQRHEALSDAEMTASMRNLLMGDYQEAEATAWLLAMEEKPITAPELAAAAGSVLAAALPFPHFSGGMDCCGTGGDGANTLNVSTAVAFVLAASGVQVLKHGNRAVSSKSGSADVLQALGITLQPEPALLADAATRLGLAFLFAQQFHPGLVTLAPLRRAIGKRTLFNLLGPLCNPARPHMQLMGVYGPHLLPLMAEALRNLGSTHALVLHSDDGLDEASISAPTRGVLLQNGVLHDFAITPEEAGLPRHPPEALRGGDAATNADAMLALFTGAPGAYHDAVCLNAGLGLFTAGRAATPAEGVAQAAQAIASGQALKLLEEYRKIR